MRRKLESEIKAELKPSTLTWDAVVQGLFQSLSQAPTLLTYFKIIHHRQHDHMCVFQVTLYLSTALGPNGECTLDCRACMHFVWKALEQCKQLLQESLTFISEQ